MKAHKKEYEQLVQGLQLNKPLNEVLEMSIWNRRLPQLPIKMLELSTVHRGIFHQCRECDYKSNSNQNLKTHFKSKHLGIKYDCSHCLAKFSTTFGLKLHVQTIHDGIRFDCNKCDYKFTQKQLLKNHIRLKHT